MWTQKDEERLEKFCYYGFSNRDVMQDAIIFFTNHEILMKRPLEDIYKIPLEKNLEQLCTNASKIYRQFYRFIYLHDSNEEKGKYSRQNFSNEAEEKQGIKLKIQTRIQELIKSEKILPTKAGIYFSREQERYFSREYCYQESHFGTENAWWTFEMYELLVKLDNLEQESRLQYYNKWLFTKLKRAKSNNESLEKIKKIEEAYKVLRIKNFEEIQDNER